MPSIRLKRGAGTFCLRLSVMIISFYFMLWVLKYSVIILPIHWAQRFVGAYKSSAINQLTVCGKNSSQETSDIWIRITNELYLYSAFLDVRPDSALHKNCTLVKIIGIIRTPSMKDIIKTNPLNVLTTKDEKIMENFDCKLFVFSKNGLYRTMQSVHISFKVFEEGMKTFTGAFIHCYFEVALKMLKSLVSAKDTFVSLYPKSMLNYPDKLIRVQKFSEIKHKHQISVCVRPFFGPFIDLVQLAQFVSYYNKLGVKKFTFYNLSISPQIKQYIENLHQHHGEISIFLKIWNVPSGNTSELWDFGGLAALNDCLYSNMADDFLLFVDIDEFIVLRNRTTHPSLTCLIKFYSPFRQLLVRNTFFCHEFCRERLATALKKAREIQSKGNSNYVRLDLLPINVCNVRTKRIWGAEVRAKFIISPKEVVSVGHHMVTRYSNGSNLDKLYLDKLNMVASPDVAVLGHYRECWSISSKLHPILNRLVTRDMDVQKISLNMTLLMP